MKRLSAFLIIALTVMSCSISSVHARQAGERELIYAADFNFTPYRIIANGEFGGFEIDVTKAVFQNSKYTLRYRDVAWAIDKITEMFRDPDWDVIGWRIVDPIITAEYTYSDPVFQYHWGVFSLQGIGKLDINQLHGYKIGLAGRKYPFAWLTQHGYKENEHLVVYPGQEEAMNALMSGDVDLWFDDKLAASYTLMRSNLLSNTTYHEELEVVKQVCYAMRPVPENDELAEFINKRIKEIKEGGQFEYLYKLYFGSNSDEYIQKQQQDTMLIVLAMVLVLIILTGLSIISLRFLRKYSKASKELQQTVTELDTSREQYRIAIESANDGIIYYDESMKYPFLSERFYRILGLNESASYDINSLILEILSLSSGDYHDSLIELQTNISSHNEFVTATEIMLKHEGSDKWVMLKAKSYVEDDFFRLGGTLSDITTRKEQEAVIVYFASCDPLTGISNRRRMAELGNAMIEASKEGGQSLSIIYIDLDNFKAVNDLFGHQQGDQVLISVVDCMKQLLPKDAVLARVGGDEFVIILPDKYRATAIMQSILSSIVALDTPVPVSASIGVTFYPQHGEELDTLIKNADSASRYAKSHGKSRVSVFTGGQADV